MNNTLLDILFYKKNWTLGIWRGLNVSIFYTISSSSSNSSASKSIDIDKTSYEEEDEAYLSDNYEQEDDYEKEDYEYDYDYEEEDEIDGYIQRELDQQIQNQLDLQMEKQERKIDGLLQKTFDDSMDRHSYLLRQHHERIMMMNGEEEYADADDHPIRLRTYTGISIDTDVLNQAGDCNHLDVHTLLETMKLDAAKPAASNQEVILTTKSKAAGIETERGANGTTIRDIDKAIHKAIENYGRERDHEHGHI